MPNINDQSINTQPEAASWEVELKQVGFVRRIFMARHWYGADWWFVAVSAVMVVAFIVIAIFPQWFAPYSPDALVGPRFTAPGAAVKLSILIVPNNSSFKKLQDLAVSPGAKRPTVAVQIGLPTSGDLNDESQKIDEIIKDQPAGLRLRPIIDRYLTIDETIKAVVDGKDEAAVLQTTDLAAIKANYPTLREAGTLSGGAEGGYILGTNDIGQDVLSRLLWGTRIGLIIGFSASILSLVLGVPLGLIAGFVGGGFDRVLSLLMDSLYSFPGLILAIAITAVLGPSILNIILAISVVYIPTYYRIVRGQTLTVKEEVYVEAAKSIGAKRLEILTRYIFPNVIPSVAIIFSVNVADAILTGAGLSFLGLGLPPTIADWGIDLARGQRFIQTAWWMITFPGLVIMLVVLSFTLMGEGLTEIFNPKLRDR
jgi:peptide/nickel transport system permease protein